MSQKAGKQRKRDDSDDNGLSTAGKVALGVAAAAAGAAVGYFGSRLLSSWLSESGTEEKEKKCDASKSHKDDSKNDEVMSGANAQCTGRHDMNAAGIQQPSLHEELLLYYQQYVDIPAARLQAVQTVVQQVTRAVTRQLGEPPNSFKRLALKIGDMVSFGSASEGLQVVRPNCFDVMVPVMFGSGNSHAHEASVGGRQVAGSYVIVLADDSGQLCDDEQRLVTAKLVDVLQVVIEKAAQDVTGYHCIIQPPSQTATTVSLAMYVDGSDVTVNFHPFVIIGDQLFLPADPTWSSTQCDVDGRLWMQSFVRQEKWSVDRFDSSVCGHLMALKILKAIRLNHVEQFGSVSSYHLKILLFHVLEDLPDSCDWLENAVGERLIDLLTRLTQALRDHHMSHYFDQNVNTLQHVPREMSNNLAKFLEKKLAHNDITSLLKRAY